MPASSETTAPRPRAKKSAAAFRTISEVATELGLPQHVLRFWESKFSQISPMKRGGGRRYYRPEDVDLLRRIRQLLYDDGYTIKGVQKLLRQESGRSGESKTAVAAASKKPATEGPALGKAQKDELRAVLKELEELKRLLK